MKETFAMRLRELIKKSGYTQKQVADLVGVTEAAFSRYMNSERIPKAAILANIATCLQTTSQYLLTGKDPFSNFAEIKGFVARSAENITEEQRNDLIGLLESINKRMEQK
jgi:transcriptional regulator with XRE-family HTH domain